MVDSPDWNSLTGAVTLGDGSHLITGVVGSSNSLTGAAPGDEAGSGGITVLSGNASYVVSSPDWSGHAGAVTLLSDSNTVVGAISALNSLVGASANDAIGSGGITVLGDGNILILSPSFGGGAGAVTWDGVAAGQGQVGVVGSGNSLVGANPGDDIGSGGIFELSNGTNYLVLSPSWGGGKGAITTGNEGEAITGVVSGTTSLVGSSTTDHVGMRSSIIDSFDNYYLVDTANWGNGAGAVTWSLDTGGAGSVGAISASNSLVGAAGDHLGSGGITILYNGNYVVDSPQWSSRTGAVTLGTATAGVKGPVSGSNSLVGATAGDQVGSGGIFQLSNAANYLVLSPLWGNGKGAVTDETDSHAGAITGAVSSSNSIVGASTGDGVGASGSITDEFTGYYLITTADWGNGAGAVTWSLDTGGTTGAVSNLNSLVGGAAGDHIGSGGITILNNGDYVVDSPDWSNLTGAVTQGASTGISGVVGGSNSLVGASNNDEIGSGGIQLLPSGDYLVLSPHFGGNAGAVTWVDGGTGLTGQVASTDSLVGGAGGDEVGGGGIYLLSNGANYLVLSPSWSDGRGAVTNGSDSSSISGVVSDANSLVGLAAGDAVGASGSIFDPGAGYYLVRTPNWGGGAGAVTWNSDGGTTGVVSQANSLVGSNSGDDLGSGGIILLPSDNYVVLSPDWNNQAGAVTWGGASDGVSGVVGAANSLVGGSAVVSALAGASPAISGSGSGNEVGSGGIQILANGNYLVLSPSFANGAGAVTFADGSTGISGVVGAANSLIGAAGGDQIGSGGIIFLDNGNYLVVSPDFGGGAGAVTFGSRTTGVAGIVGASNSLVGADGSDHIASGGIVDLSNGDYLVLSPLFDGSAGAATWGSETTGVAGQVRQRREQHHRRRAGRGRAICRAIGRRQHLPRRIHHRHLGGR